MEAARSKAARMILQLVFGLSLYKSVDLRRIMRDLSYTYWVVFFVSEHIRPENCILRRFFYESFLAENDSVVESILHLHYTSPLAYD